MSHKSLTIAPLALFFLLGCVNLTSENTPENQRSEFDVCVEDYVQDSFTNGMTPNGGDPSEAAQGEAEFVCSPLLD